MHAYSLFYSFHSRRSGGLHDDHIVVVAIVVTVVLDVGIIPIPIGRGILLTVRGNVPRRVQDRIRAPRSKQLHLLNNVSTSSLPKDAHMCPCHAARTSKCPPEVAHNDVPRRGLGELGLR